MDSRIVDSEILSWFEYIQPVRHGIHIFGYFRHIDIHVFHRSNCVSLSISIRKEKRKYRLQVDSFNEPGLFNNIVLRFIFQHVELLRGVVLYAYNTKSVPDHAKLPGCAKQGVITHCKFGEKGVDV